MGDHSGCWPTFTNRRRSLPFVFAVQMPNVFPDSLDASRSKATLVPSGERLGLTLSSFFPPAVPTTAHDWASRIVTGAAQVKQEG